MESPGSRSRIRWARVHLIHATLAGQRPRRMRRTVSRRWRWWRPLFCEARCLRRTCVRHRSPLSGNSGAASADSDSIRPSALTDLPTRAPSTREKHGYRYSDRRTSSKTSLAGGIVLADLAPRPVPPVRPCFSEEPPCILTSFRKIDTDDQQQLAMAAQITSIPDADGFPRWHRGAGQRASAGPPWRT